MFYVSVALVFMSFLMFMYASRYSVPNSDTPAIIPPNIAIA